MYVVMAGLAAPATTNLLGWPLTASSDAGALLRRLFGRRFFRGLCRGFGRSGRPA